MPGSTQKCPPQHASVDIAIINHPLRPAVRNIFFQFFSNILFLRTNREMKMKLYWYEFKINIFNIIWILKCNHSSLFMMAIMSAAINNFYRYGRIFCQFLHFLLIAPLKSDTHLHALGLARTAGSIMHSTRTFVITVSNDRVSWCPHLEEKPRTLLPL